jgi:hypothetical protein
LPDPPDEWPVQYVLDGQQRLTSIFGVFQNKLEPNEGHESGWTDVYFDFEADADAQDSQFQCLPPDEVKDHHFPLRVLFNPANFGKEVEKLGSQDRKDTAYDLFARFSQRDIPVQAFKTDDRAGVAIVFERINRLGMELDTLQLLSAWTWSEDFDLQSKFQELAEEFEPFGFEQVGEDITLLLRCCAAVVDGDSSPKGLMSLNGKDVRDKFPEIVNGLRGAIDFVRKEFNVEQLDNLPHTSLLVPLCVFFAAPNKKSVKVKETQAAILRRWFWRAAFSARYGRVVQRNLRVDIEQMRNLRMNKKSTLDTIGVSVTPEYFTENRFNLKNVASKTFVLLLSQSKPKSLVSGNSVSIENVLAAYNRNEFHHLYPQKHLKSIGVDTAEQSFLANMCFINAIDNKILGGAAPSVYKAKMVQDGVDDVLDRAVIPKDELFADDYPNFIAKRAAMLADAAESLMA